MAWANGAYRALLEWCDEKGMECVDESASYITGVLGPEPRAIFEGCAWRREPAILEEGYATTWSILGESRSGSAAALLNRYPSGC
jgi:hypothetical protein